MIGGPYALIGGGIAAIALIAGTFFYGQSVGRAKCEVAYARQAEKDRAALEKRIEGAQAQDAVAAAADVQRETIVREITREVPRIIDRPVYRNDCADGDGVQLIKRAVEAANGRGTAGGGPAGEAGRVQPAAGDGRAGR